jgi:hypothetical protein
VLLAVLPSAFLFSQEGTEAPEIEVTNMRFDRLGDEWLVANLEIRPGKNPSPEARDEDFLDDVRLTLYLCFEVDAEGDEDGFSFYRSTVRIVSLESPNTYSVPFFLPGVIRDRDNLDAEPFAWLVEMQVGQAEVPLAEDQAGGEIRKSPEGFENFLSKASSESVDNDGILLPVYLAPGYLAGEARVNPREVPAFYRFEPEN